MNEESQRRWRLALGSEDEALSPEDQRVSTALSALYGEGDEQKRRGGLGRSAPNVAKWMGDIRSYFPASTVHIVQKDAFERLGLKQMLLEPEFLAAVEADVDLVANLISLRSIMPEKIKATAREVIGRVVSRADGAAGAAHRRGNTRRRAAWPPHQPPALRRYRLATHHCRQSAALPASAPRDCA